MASHVAPARPLPPVGATLLCLERGSTSAYPVTVERHQGRYFIAGGHRFHVYDDWKVGTARHTWRKPAAMVWMASDEEQAAAVAKLDRIVEVACRRITELEAEESCLMAASRSMDGPIDGRPVLSMAEVQWRPPGDPPGSAEPTEAW